MLFMDRGAWHERGDGDGPEVQEVILEQGISRLQLFQAPPLLVRYELVQPEPGILEAVLGIPLLGEALVTVLGVVTSKREIGEPVQLGAVYGSAVGAQVLDPALAQGLGHYVLDGERVVFQPLDYVHALDAVTVLEPVV